jgi:hypothetical protein
MSLEAELSAIQSVHEVDDDAGIGGILNRGHTKSDDEEDVYECLEDLFERDMQIVEDPIEFDLDYKLNFESEIMDRQDVISESDSNELFDELIRSSACVLDRLAVSMSYDLHVNKMNKNEQRVKEQSNTNMVPLLSAHQEKPQREEEVEEVVSLIVCAVEQMYFQPPQTSFSSNVEAVRTVVSMIGASLLEDDRKDVEGTFEGIKRRIYENEIGEDEFVTACDSMHVLPTGSSGSLSGGERSEVSFLLAAQELISADATASIIRSRKGDPNKSYDDNEGDNEVKKYEEEVMSRRQWRREESARIRAKKSAVSACIFR